MVSKRYNHQKDVQVRNLEFSMDWVFDESATRRRCTKLSPSAECRRYCGATTCASWRMVRPAWEDLYDVRAGLGDR